MCLVCEKTELLTIQPKYNRKKIWELDIHLHCSVIGTCLSLKELRKLCSKARITFASNITTHDLHTSFVTAAGEKTYLTQLLQKHLDRKYHLVIQQFSRLTCDSALESLWKKSVSEGDVAAAYWAIVTSPIPSIALLGEIFGEVHMLSHLSGASLRMDMQAFKKLRRQVPALETDLNKMKMESHQRQQAHEKTARELNLQLGTMRVEAEKFKQIEQQLRECQQNISQSRLHKQLKETETQFTRLQKQHETSANQADEWHQKTIKEQRYNKDLRQQILEIKAERNALEKVVEQLLEPECKRCSHNDQYSNNSDLEGRCIMFVGGRYRQCSHFRALVEHQNGRFVHHDGGLENSRAQLGKTLSQADVVVCPLDCMSHAAMNTVKQHCEKMAKQLVLLPHASLSAFSKGLEGIAVPN